MNEKATRILGWVAAGISTLITCFWAFWGIIENFHEGWYARSIWANLGLMLVQYLGPMLLFMAATLVAIRRRRVGYQLHAGIALFAIWFFDAFSNAATFLIILPLIGLGALYWAVPLQPRKRALQIAAALPLVTLLVAGIEPVWRVSQRVFDGDMGARSVSGNGVTMVWAPQGTGWPIAGTDWGCHAPCASISMQTGWHLRMNP